MRARCLRRRKEGGEAGSQERRDKSWSQPRSVEEGLMLLDQGPTFWRGDSGGREDQISRSGNIVQNNQTLPLIPVQHSTNFYQSFDFLQKKTKIARDFTPKSHILVHWKLFQILWATISNNVLEGWMHFWPLWSWTQVRCLLGHVLPLVMFYGTSEKVFGKNKSLRNLISHWPDNYTLINL